MKYELKSQIFINAMPVMKKIENCGYEAYFVGGCVRDFIMNREIHDIDIASSALPEEIEQLFTNTIDLGKEHGTIIAIYNGEPYEITTFRTESNYSDFRRPDKVNFVRNLEEDTLRRDFTINALAFDRHGNIYDFHNGLNDIENKLIRAVGNPKDRFSEDALRMIRAIRFSSQLGFQIEEETLDAILELVANIKYLSMERIRVEFSKFLLGKHFIKNADYLISTNIYKYLPKFNTLNIASIINELKNSLTSYYNFNSVISENMIWALFFYYSELPLIEIKKILRYWTHSNKAIDSITSMIFFLRKNKENNVTIKDLYNIKSEELEEIQLFVNSQSSQKNKDYVKMKKDIAITNRKDINISGNEIINILNLNQGGPIIGQYIEMVEDAIIHNKLNNNYQEIKEFIINDHK